MTSKERRVGRDWYPRLNRWLRAMADQHIFPFENVVCAFAAMSPRISYRHNCIALVNLIRNGDNHLGYTSNTEKAKRLLWSNAPLKELAKKSPCKTECFARAILGDTQAVTLDTWMLSYLDFTGWITPRRYERMSEQLSDEARVHGETPRDYQAIVWISVRKKHV
jgi:hypothetical protein